MATGHLLVLKSQKSKDDPPRSPPPGPYFPLLSWKLMTAFMGAPPLLLPQGLFTTVALPIRISIQYFVRIPNLPAPATKSSMGSIARRPSGLNRKLARDTT